MQKSMGILVLPVDCIALILSFTSPRDVFVSSMVSSLFRSAAESDDVWEKFLPLGYKDILSRSSLNMNSFSSKKQLFSRLCGPPILLEGDNKSLNLDKSSGKVCLMLGAKELTISWSDDIKWRDTPGQGLYFDDIVVDYWRWISASRSRFAEAIEVVSSEWLQISGKVNTQMLSPDTCYVVYLVFKLTDYARGFGCQGDWENKCMYGLADSSVEFIRGEGKASGTCTRYLDEECNPRTHDYDGNISSESEEGDWLELELGEFYNSHENDGEVEMILKDEFDGHWIGTLWKDGLIIQGIELKPKRTSK